MMASATHASWQAQPYRLFFPLGLVLIWAGVLHWLLHGLGLLPQYRPVFHAITQIQGFMTCFAVGFLFTAIPRRTGTSPPNRWQVAWGLIAPVGCTVAAWFELWAVSQTFWILLVFVVGAFAVRRFLDGGARRRPPNSFIWIPFSLFVGICGSALIAAYGILGAEYFHLHELGKLLLLQGMFSGLVVGLGGMVLPLLTRGTAPADSTSSTRDRLFLAGHVLGGLLLVGSFLVETRVSLRWGLAGRAVLLLILLLAAAGIARPPRVPGWHRWWVWLAAWMLPVGYAFAAIFPAQKKAGLHVVFIGGFALLAFSVALHVTLAHGGYEKLIRGRPWQVPFFGGTVLSAVVIRSLVDFDPERFFVWIAASAGLLLLATVFWSLLVLPRLISGESSGAGGG